MTRKLAILWLLVVSMLIAACGGEAATPTVVAPTSTVAVAPTATVAVAPTDTVAAAPTNTVAPTNTAAVAPTATTATTAPTSTTEAAASADWPRTIKYSGGEITLESPAIRVAALEWTYIEDLLALGVQPVGATIAEGYSDYVKIPVALDPGVQDLGSRSAPNMEQLALLKPDLILTPSFRGADAVAELSKIAPTMVFNPYPADPTITQYDEMRESFLAIAAATGRDIEGRAVLDRMVAKFAQTSADLAAAGKGGQKFILSQAYSSEGTAAVRLFTDNAMATEIVAQLGLENAWKPETPEVYGFSTVSIEVLPEIDADVNFFYVVADADNPFAGSAIKPLWDNLPFVKAGHAYPLGGDTWLFGGPLSAELLVDIVVDTLAP